ncbi:MAG: hypothetical protein N2449_05285 [Bacteroidales bacterium]|nr:hypothetical protein [Bacteroidales bacterium]
MTKILSVLFLIIIIINCSKIATNNIKKSELKTLTIEELVSGPDWEFVDDSVYVDGIYCKQYRNKITNQNILIAPE